MMAGPLMTSLDMHGFSLSVLELDVVPECEAALMHPVEGTAWTGMKRVVHHAPLPLPQPPMLPASAGIVKGDNNYNNTDVHRAIRRVCARLLQMEAELNALVSIPKC